MQEGDTFKSAKLRTGYKLRQSRKSTRCLYESDVQSLVILKMYSLGLVVFLLLAVVTCCVTTLSTDTTVSVLNALLGRYRSSCVIFIQSRTESKYLHCRTQLLLHR